MLLTQMLPFETLLQHSTSTLQAVVELSAMHVVVESGTQCLTGGFVNGVSRAQMLVGEEAVPPQQSRFESQRVPADFVDEGAMHAGMDQ
jgi:hypothetical protein